MLGTVRNFFVRFSTSIIHRSPVVNPFIVEESLPIKPRRCYEVSFENPDVLHIVTLPNADTATLVTKLKQMLVYSHTLKAS